MTYLHGRLETIGDNLLVLRVGDNLHVLTVPTVPTVWPVWQLYGEGLSVCAWHNEGHLLEMRCAIDLPTIRCDVGIDRIGAYRALDDWADSTARVLSIEGNRVVMEYWDGVIYHDQTLEWYSDEDPIAGASYRGVTLYGREMPRFLVYDLVAEGEAAPGLNESDLIRFIEIEELCADCLTVLSLPEVSTITAVVELRNRLERLFNSRVRLLRQPENTIRALNWPVAVWNGRSNRNQFNDLPRYSYGYDGLESRLAGMVQSPIIAVANDS